MLKTLLLALTLQTPFDAPCPNGQCPAPMVLPNVARPILNTPLFNQPFQNETILQRKPLLQRRPVRNLIGLMCRRCRCR